MGFVEAGVLIVGGGGTLLTLRSIAPPAATDPSWQWLVWYLVVLFGIALIARGALGLITWVVRGGWRASGRLRYSIIRLQHLRFQHYWADAGQLTTPSAAAPETERSEALLIHANKRARCMTLIDEGSRILDELRLGHEIANAQPWIEDVETFLKADHPELWAQLHDRNGLAAIARGGMSKHQYDAITGVDRALVLLRRASPAVYARAGSGFGWGKVP